MGISETLVSRLKSGGDIEQFSKILALLDVKVVPVSLRCYDPKEIDALLTLATRRLNGMDQPDELEWE